MTSAKAVSKADVLASLSEDQQGPVKDYEGASYILAGPGAGSTHV